MVWFLYGNGLRHQKVKMISAKLQFFDRQNESLKPKLSRLLYNSLIQPYIGYACISWYPLGSKEIQVTQSKCIRFCLKRNSRHHIGAKEFDEINWLPMKERVEQRIATSVFKYWKGTSPFYVNELFVSSRNIFKARPHMALEIPLRKSNLGQKSISFMGPSIWNKSSNDLKLLNTATWFNRNYKKLVLKDLEWVEHKLQFYLCYHYWNFYHYRYC